MKQTIYAPNTVPTAHIAVNKSRIKLYTKAGDMPTYYLQKGQEFSIELFNPTSEVVLAKIHLNGKVISQGGLVLNPGQRVFLDRHLDVAKKFLFDTYEVAKTAEVKKAIENNGDIKVEFYKERQQYYTPITIRPDWTYRPAIYFSNTNIRGPYTTGTDPKYLSNGHNGTLSMNSLINNSVTTTTITTTNDLFDINTLDNTKSFEDIKKNNFRLKKCIETGRVEKGSHSEQEFDYVNKSFEYYAFHTVEYKLLPVSQKINTVADINVKKYCTDCGSKLGKTNKFCANCGKKA